MDGIRCPFQEALKRRESQRDAVHLGWPIASPDMSDRLERKRQNGGGGVAGYHWLCTAVSMESNYFLMIYLAYSYNHKYRNNGLLICGKTIGAHPVFGTVPDRNKVTWETPSSVAIPSFKSQ
jgi:hypothetical protein